MRLVVGLGNPGERYRRTRHNVGFMVIDALSARTGARGREEGHAWTAPTRIGDQDVLLVKPTTFMNRSGLAVQALLQPGDSVSAGLVVIVDDVALELGTIRVREQGSHGSHNGLRSIIETVGTEEFPRVRVGIREGDPPDDLADYVLSDFPREDVLVVQEVVGWAADAVECLIHDGPAAAMNRFNGLRRP
jgi:peptidyl-tRNA hydrolase, PTH1 family